MTEDALARVTRLFDELAPDYDQSGVAFFAPIAERLVELLEVRRGERALDLGCGRGAVLLPLAVAVGPAGRVTAVDVSPAMVALAESAAAGLDNVQLCCADATAPGLPERAFDVVASSLVLFFLPDPAAAVRHWLRLVGPGGRLGISTFGPQDEVWTSVDALFASYLPAGMLDARTSGTQGIFADVDGVARLCRESGAAEARTVTERLPVVFDDAEAWRRFSMSVGQRAMWRQVPAGRREELYGEAAALLEGARRGDGRIELTQQVRYTLARV